MKTRNDRPSIIFIVGPTSSGKSKVAVELAKRIGGEIFSCDSMQVYRDMDVINQAPAEEIMSGVKHHIVRVIPPEEEFSAAKFAQMAEQAVGSIISSGKVPIGAGGTGLYIKSLVDGIFESPPKDPGLRERLKQTAAQNGKEYLHVQLEKIDPETAGKLHPNDLRRVIRAFEVYELTGRTIHDKKSEKEGIAKKYEIRMFGLSLPRKILYDRINSAVDNMFERGIVKEVESLRGRALSLTAGKALGIKEVSSFFDGKRSVEEAKEELKRNTRKYAKRQLTWFRADGRVEWLDADRDPGEIAEEIRKLI